MTALVAASLRAQPRIVLGIVRDGREQPVPQVTVRGAGIRQTTTDDSGRFRLEITHHDLFTLELRRVGYLPSRVGVAAGSDTTIAVLILPAVRELPRLQVSAPSTLPPSLAGFEARMGERKRGAGTGLFITAAEIASMNPLRTAQILENMPSLAVRRYMDGRFGIFGKAGGGAECPATLYLDGVRLASDVSVVVPSRGRAPRPRESDLSIDSFVEPTDIAGVEVYPRGALAPQQFQPPTSRIATQCAIVLFWTKHG